ncbi:calcium/sodium antiporter [Maribellus comscasis]|uniref:Calcium/sodium antiporter n=1 Tax=Maribellus comscasis TaxID=2681766 RepID=A0A6I6JRZ6_9BACT|nr:calcium/sodium antiporter [Maribellus comscasis]QGY43850.1 calcium/sodium antiporter [Maribellus comscasis]
MVLAYILGLLVCFILLARIVDQFFIHSLDRISKDLKLSSDAAGATLMAVGSSAPELFVALFAIFKPGEHEAIGVGSIVGSAIFNLLVIVGASAIVRKAKLTWQPVIRDLIFYTISVSLLLLFIWDGSFSLAEAGILLAVYIIYVIAAIYWKRFLPYTDLPFDETKTEEKKKRGIIDVFDQFLGKLFPEKKYYYLVFLQSIIIIAGLSWVLVELAVLISHHFNIPEGIIALTVLAIGTSIPDLFSSMIVAKQGRGDMAVSNAIGSNIFDILVGLGLPFAIYMFIHGGKVGAGDGNLLYSTIILFSSVILLLFLLLFSKWRVGKISGIFLVLLYAIYVVREIIILYI